MGDVEAVLVHVDFERLNGSPERAISEPLRSLDAVGIAGGLVIHHLEHELRDRVPVIAHEFPHSAAQTLRPAAFKNPSYWRRGDGPEARA